MDPTIPPKTQRTTAPAGNLVVWKLRANEEGRPVTSTVLSGLRPTVQVSGVFHKARVEFLGTCHADADPVTILDRDGTKFGVEAEGMIEVPASPPCFGPVVDGGDDGTDITITLFVAD